MAKFNTPNKAKTIIKFINRNDTLSGRNVPYDSSYFCYVIRLHASFNAHEFFRSNCEKEQTYIQTNFLTENRQKRVNQAQYLPYSVHQVAYIYSICGLATFDKNWREITNLLW